VTLGEAYQFAFNETLQKTQATSGGAQHPSRDMNLAGTGDVVMTDVRETSAGLLLESELEGRVFIRDAKGNLVAELYKNKGRALELGLAPGRYQVQLEQNQVWKADNISLTEGKKLKLSHRQFKQVHREQATARGGSTDSSNSLLDSARRMPFRMETSLFYEDSDAPMRGMQMSLLITDARAELSGSQIALLANVARKDMEGLQINTSANVALENLDGSQVTMGVNYANSIHGAQVSAGFNIAGNTTGAQAASGFNLAYGMLNGVQVGPINIATKGGKGVQGGVINITTDSLDGVQGGVINVATKVHYVQAGVINAAYHGGVVQGGVFNAAGSVDEVQGGLFNKAASIGQLQIGLLNIAGTVHGRQIGLFNFSLHSEKTPIGLVNFVGNGIWDATFSMDEQAQPGLELRMGTPWLYTLFEYRQKGKDQWPKSWGMGLGTRFGMRHRFLYLDYTLLNTYLSVPDDIHVGVHVRSDEESNYWHKIRLGAGYQILPGIALNGGASMNILTQAYMDELTLAPRGDYHWNWDFGSGHRARLWPGVFAGITIGRF